MIRLVCAAACGWPCTGRFSSGLLSLLLVWGLLAPLQSDAQTYTSASTPYSLIDSSGHSKVGHNTAPHKFGAAAGCGTTPPVLDDTLSTLIPLGFSFTFGGTAYTSAYIQSNGRLQFANTTCGSGTASAGNPQTYPYGFPNASMNGVLKIFGVDLDHTNLVDQPNYPSSSPKTPCTSLATCYVSVATIGSAPARQFVVTWKNVPEWVAANNTSGSFDLQIILNEDGSFVFQYGSIVHGGTGTAQIGWQVSSTDFQVLAFGASAEPPPNSAIVFYIPAPVAAYRFEEGAWAPDLAGQVVDSSGKAHPGQSVGNAQPGATGRVCRGLDIPANTDAATVDAVKTGVDLSSTALSLQGSGTVAFWFRSNLDWNGGVAAQLLDASTTDREWFYLSRQASGQLSFGATDSLGAYTQVNSAVQLFSAGTWVHVAIAWNYNGAAGINQDNLRLFINGSQVAITSFTSNGTITTRAGAVYLGDNPSGFAHGSGTVNSANGQFDELQVFNYILSAAQLGTLMSGSRPCTALSFDHLEILHASGSGLTCTPTVLSLRACQDAACTTPYLGGLAGTLRASGSAFAFDNSGNGRGAGFVIPAGSSSVSKGLQVTAVGSALVAVNGLSIAAAGNHSCNFGAPRCTVTSADAGFLLAAPHHVAESLATLTVSAVRKADNGLACVPAFANTSKSVTFGCSYANPASGTLAARVGGTAVNAGGSAAAACDATGRAVSVAFNASGVATPSLQYADVGNLVLTARYNGSAATTDSGLVMSGSASVITAPHSLAITALTAGPIKAGSPFAATVSARNATGAITPNFARESPAESVSLGWVRLLPTGVGSVRGSFTGSLGSFASGSASAGNLAWTEVGRGDLLARLTSNNYLGSGWGAFGSSVAQGALHCANEGGTCTLPAGATATVYYGNDVSYAVKTGVSGTVACSNGVFGDPLSGVVKKCWYVGTAASNGSVGDLIPHHFDVTASAACGSFTYAGQPFSATVTARNAAGTTTVNYDGTANSSPNFAKVTTLSDAAGLGLGSWSGHTLPASAFVAGVGRASPAYTYTTKTTGPRSVVLRAVDTDAVQSAGHAEPGLALRSGRLRLSNAFGRATSGVQVPVVTEYWNDSAWLLNSADRCTTVPAGSVAMSNPRSATGGTSTATSSAAAVTLTSGSGLLNLAAPTPAGSSLSLDLAINLGSTAADQSCHASHPATTGAAMAWLRAQNGSCAATADRDPAARASFGIFSPESRKTVHVRELF